MVRTGHNWERGGGWYGIEESPASCREAKKVIAGKPVSLLHSTAFHLKEPDHL
jgi:hypothetical protein